MAIITISRGSYSKGKEVAEMVADQLGYNCISREVLLDASEHFNIPEIKLVHAIHDAPSILDRFNRNREVFIAYIRSTLVQRVKNDNVVYHGLAGHLLLTGISTVLKVRITAKLEDRVAAEMERKSITRKKARELLLKDDLERRKWTKSLYGVDPWDSSLYDITIRIGKLTVNDAVNFICQAATQDQFKPSDTSRRKLEDLAIACQIKSALVMQFPDVGVKCDYGNVIIYIKGDERSVKNIKKKVIPLKEEMEGINNLEIHAGTHYPPDTV